ncbi:MAG: flagellar assembly protein FliW [Clostridia bacterium]|jgi:flagellar assembly factor FliW|nr:flagellar assembly protein FliW [Clostridia bacterium]
MEIETKYFSNIQYTDDEVIFFKDGLFGFDNYKKYLLIRFDNENSSLLCLQSLDEKNIAFVVINPYYFIKDYKVDVPDDDCRQLKISNASNVMVYNICVVNDTVLKCTANLKCPIIVNQDTRLAKQIILEDSSYPFKYPFSKFINKEA